MKREVLVLDALAEYGDMTSHELSAVVDLPVNHCSAYLSGLAEDGLVVRKSRRFTRYPKKDGRRGGWSYLWGLPP